jgi:hypothetical protein
MARFVDGCAVAKMTTTLMHTEKAFLTELARLRPRDQKQLRKLLVSPYLAPVQSCPGESVVVVAKRDEHVLYWSDVEGGWEWERLEADGSLRARGCNQFELRQMAQQIFEDAARSRCLVRGIQ